MFRKYTKICIKENAELKMAYKPKHVVKISLYFFGTYSSKRNAF